MILSQEALAEFRALYKTHYGIELSDEEAGKAASWLIGMYKAVYSPSLKGTVHPSTK